MSRRNEKPADRTRTHPEKRFAPPAQVFDVSTAAAAEVLAEPSTTTKPHRQMTLHRHGAASLSLFLIEAGSKLREHRANGTVFIRVLNGHTTVHAQGARHELTSGQVLVMSPGVPHDLRADEATAPDVVQAYSQKCTHLSCAVALAAWALTLLGLLSQLTTRGRTT